MFLFYILHFFTYRMIIIIIITFIIIYILYYIYIRIYIRITSYYCISMVIHHLGGRDDPFSRRLKSWSAWRRWISAGRFNGQGPGDRAAPFRRPCFGMGFEWKKWDSNGKLRDLPSGKLTCWPWFNSLVLMETNLPSPMTARVYVNLPQGNPLLKDLIH